MNVEPVRTFKRLARSTRCADKTPTRNATANIDGFASVVRDGRGTPGW